MIDFSPMMTTCRIMLVGCLIVFGGAVCAQTIQVASDAMVDVVIPPGWKGVLKNMGSSPPDETAKIIVAFSDAVGRVGGKLPDAMQLFNMVPQIRMLYPKGDFDTAKAAILTDRLKAVQPTQAAAWQEAMTAVTGTPTDASNAVLHLVQAEPAWRGSTLDEQAWIRTRKKLRSIPKAALGAWSIVSKDADMVALCLLNTAALFKADAFNTELFEKAVPNASQKYHSRKQ